MKEENRHRDELTELAPFLASLPRVVPFRVPDGYFDRLPEALESAIRSAESIQHAGPATTGFTVPDGYFESLPLRIQDRIASGRKTARPWALRPVVSLSLAVAVVAVFLLTRQLLWTDGQQNATQAPALTADEISQSGFLGTLDEHSLMELMDADQDPVASATDLDAAIKDYLLENRVDITLLTNQLSSI